MGLDAKLRTWRRASHSLFSPMLSPCSHKSKSKQEVTPCLNYLYLSSISHNSSETRSNLERKKRPSSSKDFHKSSLLPVHEDVDDMCPSS